MQRSAWLPNVLGTGAFVVGTCELVLAGLLPRFGGSFGISIATAGQVVTFFGVTAAVSGLALAVVMARHGRRAALLLALVLYVLGTALSGLAWSFGVLLASQMLAACGAGLFLPTATVVAAGVVAREQRGNAVATVTTGMTVAIAVGAPAGTAVATQIGWRWTMAVLSASAVAVTGAVLVRVPPLRVADDDIVDSRHRLSPLTDRRLLALLATTLIAFTAIYVPYTYTSIVVGEATAGDGVRLAVVLCVIGVAGILGNLVAGKLTDRIGGRPVVAGALIGLAAVFAATPIWSSTLTTALIAAAAYGFLGFGVSAPQTHRILTLGRPSSVSVALNAAALYGATALSGLVGGVGIATLGPGSLSLVAVAGLAVALVLSEYANRLVHGHPARS